LAIWYVDNVASGANNGTSWANAWESFADIVWGSMNAGDTLYISGGAAGQTYNEQLNIGASGSSGNSIYIKTGAAHPTLSSGHDGTVTIDLSDAANSRGINFGSYNYIVVDGEKSGSRNLIVTNTERYGIHGSEMQGVKFKYIQITYCGNNTGGDEGTGLYASGTDSDFEIDHCMIDNNWRHGMVLTQNVYPSTDYGHSGTIHHSSIIANGEDGMYISGGFDVHNCIIGVTREYVNDYSDGIQVHGGYLKIYNNVFYCDHYKSPTGNDLLFIELYGNNNRDFDNILVYNNIFFATGTGVNNTHEGIVLKIHDHDLHDTVTNFQITNNTFIDLGGNAIRFVPYNTSSKYRQGVIKNNLIYNCNGQLNLANADYTTSDVVVDYNLWTGQAYFDGTSYASVAAFNDATGFSHNRDINDYILSFVNYQQDSTPIDDVTGLNLASNDTAAKDAGETLTYNTDIVGTSRPQGAAWDIGAYEVDESGIKIVLILGN